MQGGAVDTDRILEFARIVELGSITRAARVLNTSQSTLSKHVAELEGTFGVRLLDRLPGGVAPTAAGNALYAGSADILARVSALEARMHKLRSVPQRRLVVASYAGYGPTDDLISLAAETLEHTAPGVTIDSLDLTGTHGNCLDLLRSGEVDACLSVMPDSGDFAGLERKPMLNDRLVFVARGDSALAFRRDLTVADLTGEVIWVSDEPGQPYCERVREMLDALGLSYALFTKPPLRGVAGRDTLNVGRGGLGVALRSMVGRLVPRSKMNALSLIDIDDERLSVQVELVRRAEADDAVHELVSAIDGAERDSLHAIDGSPTP